MPIPTSTVEGYFLSFSLPWKEAASPKDRPRGCRLLLEGRARSVQTADMMCQSTKVSHIWGVAQGTLQNKSNYP